MSGSMEDLGIVVLQRHSVKTTLLHETAGSSLSSDDKTAKKQTWNKRQSCLAKYVPKASGG